MKKNNIGKKLKYGCNKTQLSHPHFLKWLTFKSYNCILCRPWFAFHILSLEYIALKWILWAKDGLYWQFGLKRVSDKMPNCDFVSAPEVVSTSLPSRRCPELKDSNAWWFWFNFVAAPMVLSLPPLPGCDLLNQLMPIPRQSTAPTTINLQISTCNILNKQTQNWRSHLVDFNSNLQRQ